jgi:hypothetical protein
VEGYFEEATAGSTLIPLVAAWLFGLEQKASLSVLEKVVREKLAHCNLQLWLPDDASEERLYVSEEGHGRSLFNLSLENGASALVSSIQEACRLDKSFDSLSPMKTGFWPIILLACRYHGLPIPPQFWIGSIAPENPGVEATRTSMG